MVVDTRSDLKASPSIKVSEKLYEEAIIPRPGSTFLRLAWLLVPLNIAVVCLCLVILWRGFVGFLSHLGAEAGSVFPDDYIDGVPIYKVVRG